MSLDPKLIKAIEDSLPAIQVKNLTSALNELDLLRVEADSLRESSKADRAEIQRLRNEVADETRRANAAEAKIEAASGRATEAETAQRNSVVDKAQAELAAVERTVDKFLKNTIYREQVQRQVPVSYSGSTTQYINGQPQLVPTSSTSLQPATDITVSGNDLADEPADAKEGK